MSIKDNKNKVSKDTNFTGEQEHCLDSMDYLIKYKEPDEVTSVMQALQKKCLNSY